MLTEACKGLEAIALADVEDHDRHQPGEDDLGRRHDARRRGAVLFGDERGEGRVAEIADCHEGERDGEDQPDLAAPVDAIEGVDRVFLPAARSVNPRLLG